jgi:shikimate 5-dehydrogenase
VVDRVLFVGVTTRQSRIHELFPHWMSALGRDVHLQGVDLALDSPREAYRRLVRWIAADESIIGAVVTSHKLSLFAACHDLFSELDPYAALANEVNAIWQTPRGLVAGARDPIAISACLSAMLEASHWHRHQADVLCLGAGGAGTALALSLLATGDRERSAQPGRPRQLIFSDIRSERLDVLATTLAKLGPRASDVALVPVTGLAESDALLALAPPHSLIVNATGLGKDAPGSPLSGSAVFPSEAITWELNYRGHRPFLAQARAQDQRNCLRVHDGWLYFLHGWLEALVPILGLEDGETSVARLRQLSKQ